MIGREADAAIGTRMRRIPPFGETVGEGEIRAPIVALEHDVHDPAGRTGTVYATGGAGQRLDPLDREQRYAVYVGLFERQAEACDGTPGIRAPSTRTRVSLIPWKLTSDRLVAFSAAGSSDGAFSSALLVTRVRRN